MIDRCTDNYCYRCTSGDQRGDHSGIPFQTPVPGIIAKPPVMPDIETLRANAPAPVVSESTRRKGMPLFGGVLMYFPDALLAVAEHSRKNNDKHNPGQPLHWSRGKSADHADCVARHLIDIGPDWTAVDPESGSLHAAALAWRALAILQLAIEKQKEKK